MADKLFDLAEKPQFVVDFPRSRLAESFRIIRTNLLLAHLDRLPRSILITSASRSEGKSTVSSYLAMSVAQTEQKVALLDCDFRLPKQHRLFGLSNHHGLTWAARQDIDLIRQLEFGAKVNENLRVMPTGPLPPNPAEFATSNRFLSLIQASKDAFDMVVIDSPPIGAVTDAAVLSAAVDGVVFVIDPALTSRPAALAAVAALRRVNAVILGVVVNNVSLKETQYGGYGAYGYSDYGKHQNGAP